jgi:phospholipid/cholesterol/gamma-HCH transport system permease protein
LITVGSATNAVVAKPVRAVGGFFAMSLDTFILMFTPPFAWREFVNQIWFVARVSLVPTLLMSIPFCTQVIFNLNILLVDLGAADLSGVGASVGIVNQIGPIVDVLVVAGAGATAMCADLGARTIREELDAMRVMGINPVQALVVPRVLAGTVVALMLFALVTLAGLAGSFFFSVYVQGVTPGAWASSLTLLIGLKDVIIAMIKATLFGLSASLIACYKGITVGGGPQGVGNAVNETVIFAFMALFAINVLLTAIGVQARAH